MEASILVSSMIKYPGILVCVYPGLGNHPGKLGNDLTNILTFLTDLLCRTYLKPEGRVSMAWLEKNASPSPDITVLKMLTSYIDHQSPHSFMEYYCMQGFITCLVHNYLQVGWCWLFTILIQIFKGRMYLNNTMWYAN